MNIGIFANTTWYLYNFRLNTMKALQNEGHTVIAIGPTDDYVDKLKKEGIQHCNISMKGSRVNPFYELGTLIKLYSFFKKQEIDIVFSFTPKANIYAALLAAPLRTYTVSNVSGLGRLFIKPTMATVIAKQLYRIAFMFSEHVFFQNNDDRKLFVDFGIVKKRKTSLLPGSGVDLKKFKPEKKPYSLKTPFTFLLIARMLKDKGVGEYVEAARVLKKQYPNSKFELLGETGADNPAAFSAEQIQDWVDEGIVRYLGKTEDVRQYLQQADCVVLPSYREGTPRSLLEAAATGQPIITTDVPGCRNVVDHERTGYLCEVKNATDLAEKMSRMIQLPKQERLELGQRGREKMEREFDEKLVIQEYISIVNKIPTGRYRIRKKLIEHMES